MRRHLEIDDGGHVRASLAVGAERRAHRLDGELRRHHRAESCLFYEFHVASAFRRKG